MAPDLPDPIVEVPPDAMMVPEEAAAEAPKPEPVSSETSLVAHFTSLVQVAPTLQPWYEQFDVDRKYVNEECLLIDDTDVVATNYILRNQIVLLANLYARDPAISWKPAPIIGEHPPLLGQYGKTLEIFCKKMAEETEMRRLLRGGIQDASTIAWQIYKLSPQEDPKLDPLGNRRQDDQLDNIARYQWLKRRFEAEQFNTDSALYQQMKDLEGVVVTYMQAKLQEDLINNPIAQQPIMTLDPMTGQMVPQMDPVTGEPMTQEDTSDPRIARSQALDAGQIPQDMTVEDIPRFIGFNLDPIQAEDFRFDWTVPSPEMLLQGGWLAHRVFMDYDKFGSSFDVTPEEMGDITVFGDDNRKVDTTKRWSSAVSSAGSAYDGEGPTDRRDMETQTNMGRCAVWEMWNKNQGLVYVWVEGMKRFLRKAPPSVLGRRWYTFYVLAFNRVTGRPIPLSDTILTRQLQDELNRRRTQEAEAQNAAFPRIFVRRGSLKEGEKDAIENSYPYQVVELDSPDDIAKAFAETKPLPFNPELYRRDETRMELEMMSGISRNAAGSGQGELATTAAIANEQMGVQTDFRRSLVEELIYDIMYDFAYMANQFMPEENWKKICGPDAYVPLLERDTFLRYLKLDVRAGSTGRPDAEKNLKVYEMLAGIAPQLGLPLDGEALLEDICYEMGKNDWRKYLMTPEKMMMKMAQGMPPPIPGGGPAGPPPGPGQPRGNAAQPAPTPGEGRPTMAESGPPTPQGVPGPV
jgi:hypothetical protein